MKPEDLRVISRHVIESAIREERKRCCAEENANYVAIGEEIERHPIGLPRAVQYKDRNYKR